MRFINVNGATESDIEKVHLTGIQAGKTLFTCRQMDGKFSTLKYENRLKLRRDINCTPDVFNLFKDY